MQCMVCKHTPACPASTTNAEGRAVCIFHADLQNCPVELRLLAQIRSPHHSAKNFAVAHLLGGQRIEPVPGETASRVIAPAAASKPNGHRAAGDRPNAKHDGSAVHREMLAVRAAAAAPVTSNTGDDCARSLGTGAPWNSTSKPNGHVGAGSLAKVTTDSQEEKKMATTTTPAATSTATVARLCKIPGCKGQLGSQNQSGLCRKHRSHTAAAASSAKPYGGHHAKSNGSKSNGKSNGHEDRLAQSVIARRVKALLGAIDLPIDAVLEVIPIEDKQRFVEDWLLAREGAA
jgi:hypothetical protein